MGRQRNPVLQRVCISLHACYQSESSWQLVISVESAVKSMRSILRNFLNIQTMESMGMVGSDIHDHDMLE